MENLWKFKAMGYRLSDLNDQAEYNHLLKRFADEEERTNLKNLLYDQHPIKRTPSTEKD